MILELQVNGEVITNVDTTIGPDFLKNRITISNSRNYDFVVDVVSASKIEALQNFIQPDGEFNVIVTNKDSGEVLIEKVVDNFRFDITTTDNKITYNYSFVKNKEVVVNDAEVVGEA